MTLKDVINILENGERVGSERDEPEGSRYIKISDTLARKMAESLDVVLEWIRGVGHER